MEAGVRSHVLECFHLEVRRAHPGFQRAEWMLDSLSADPHCLWRTIKAPLHRLYDCLMFPSSYPAFLAGRALVMKRAGLAVRAPVAMKCQAVLDRGVTIEQIFTGGASIDIFLLQIDEVRFAEAAFRLCP